MQVEVLFSSPRPVDEVSSLLLADELQRAALIADSAERARFVTGRALLRLGVAQRAGQPPLDVVFDARCPSCGRPHGKPRPLLATGAAIGRTSVSHAGNWVLVAFAPVAVGVDVERSRAVTFDGFDTMALTEAEQRQLRQRPPSGRDVARARMWVTKEAVLKLHEVGLGLEPNSVYVGLADADRVIADPVEPGQRVALVDVPLDADHQACVALASTSVPGVTLLNAGPRLTEAAERAARARSTTG